MKSKSVYLFALTFAYAGTLAHGQNVFPATGNVGIGTDNPIAKLDVRPIAFANNQSGGIQLACTDGHYPSGVFLRTDSAGIPRLAFDIDAEVLNINHNGNLGIGTTYPRAKLDMRVIPFAENQSGGIQLACADGHYPSGMFLRTDSAGVPRLAFDIASSEILNLSNLGDGYVGIGTTYPQARLDVNGQARCTTLLLTSDRNAKDNFHSVDRHAILEKVVTLPLSTWHYTNAPGVRHVGPMAQDFKAAFPELGEDDKHIATVDADGVALASIQALYDIVQEKDSEITTLKRQVSALKTELADVKDGVAARLAALEKAVSRNDVLQASFRPEAAR